MISPEDSHIGAARVERVNFAKGIGSNLGHGSGWDHRIKYAQVRGEGSHLADASS